jgi:triosephosphate isomerase (TIM)
MNMRRYLIAGNWKLNKTIEEAVTIANKIKDVLKDSKNIDICICPPFTSLYPVYKEIKNTNISLGAQNLWYEQAGAYTGEIAGKFLIDVGCKYVIVGHSERRKFFAETDELIGKKVNAATESNLIPIVCVGETLEERDTNQAYKVIETQFNGVFKNISLEKFSTIAIAYEPVWAIGTGRTATPDTAEEMHKFIRKLAWGRYTQKLAEGCRILYGGSVTPSNIESLIKEPDIDGALVGGASLIPESFIEIVRKSSV